MAKASAAPATKKDVSLLRKVIQGLKGEMRKSFVTKQDIAGLRREMHDLHGHLIGEMHDFRDNLTGKMADSQKQTIREFKVIAENIRKDGIDSHKDKISLHEDRIKRIETHVGLSHSLSV